MCVTVGTKRAITAAGFRADVRFITRFPKDKYDGNVDEDTDVLSVFDGLRVAIDKKNALYLDGVELDYHESLENRGFTFNNPNATKS